MSINVTKTVSTIIDYSAYKVPNSTWPAYFLRSGVIADLNSDGKNEFVFSITTYPAQIAVPLSVIGDDSGTLDLTSKYFPAGASLVNHAPYLLYQDVNGDGIKDIVSANCIDSPPWTGLKDTVALGNGISFADVTNLIPNTPATTTRSYSIAIGDFDSDGQKEIFLPVNDNSSGLSGLLKWNGSSFDVLPNPIPNPQWNGNFLQYQASMAVADFNSDGHDDLLVGGGTFGAATNTIVYGSQRGLDVSTINVLPNGPYAQDLHTWQVANNAWFSTRIAGGADTNSIVFDFNHDGRADIFSISEHIIYYPPGTITNKGQLDYDFLYTNGGLSFFEPSSFHTLINIDGRNFKSTIPANSDLGLRLFFDVLPYDINNDGNTDVIGHYYNKSTAALPGVTTWGTTFFLNDGQGNFKPVEAVDVFPQLAMSPASTQGDNRLSIGAIIPISSGASGFVGLQLLPEPSLLGKFTVQEFTSAQLTANNLSPDPINMSAMRITDRAYRTSITTFAGNDTIYDTNAKIDSIPNTLIISFSGEHKAIMTNPTIAVVINGSTEIEATPVTAVYGNNTQELQIDLISYGRITSLEIDISGTTFVDDSNFTNVNISAIAYKGQPIALSSATYSNGGYSGGSAYSNNGTIKFTDSSFNSANAAIELANTSIIDGGRGIDTSVYSGIRNQYQISHNSSETLSVIGPSITSDLLTNVERLQFSDGVLAFDNSRTDIAGKAYLLYRAAFDRAPDATGLGYWIRELDRGQDYGAVVAASFIASPEFIATYGTNLSNAAFLNLVYQNVLDRAPDQGGSDYWLGQLNNGYARSNLLASFAISDENYNSVAPLITDGIWFT